MKFDKAQFVVFVVVLLVCGSVVMGLTGCAASDRAAAQRANAEAEAIRARAEADAQRAQDERDASRLSHQQFLQMVPVILVGAALFVVLVLAVLFVVWDLKRVSTIAMHNVNSAPRLTMPYVVNIFPSQLPGQQRAEYWRQIEEQARDVVIYQD